MKKIIKQTYHIHASIQEVWKALVNPKYIDRWGGGPAKMNAKVGTKFSLWGGAIWGKNTEVSFEKKLTQDWYSDDDGRKWDKPSVVEFILNEENLGTKLDLIHKNVPEDDIKDISGSWKDYYLGPLKKNLENN